MKKIIGKSMGFLYSFSIRLLGLFFQFALSIAVARLLGTAGAGIYSIYTSWFNLLSNAVSFGLPQYAIRHISILHAEKKPRQIKEFIIYSLKFFLFSGLISIIVFYTFGNELAQIAAGGAANGYILKLSAVAATVFIILKFFSEILKSINKLNIAMLIESLLLPFFLVVSLYLLSNSSISDKPQAFLNIHIGILLILSCISWLLCKHELHSLEENKSTTTSSVVPESVNFKKLVPFWLSSILGMWFLSMPLLFAPVFSDIHDTGIFSSAYRLITVIVNVMMVLSGIYGPRFARNYNNKNYALLYEDLKKTAYISMGMFLPLFLIFMIFPSEILGIFGADFRAGAHWLQIMAAGQLIYSATGLVGLLLNMIHKEKLELMLLVLSSVLMVIMMLILGYLYSITGIAIAFAVGLAFKNLVSLFFAHSILKKLIATHINHSA